MTTEATTVVSDRVKLPFSYDVNKMLTEYNALGLEDFKHYSTIPLRAPAHMVDSSIPEPPKSDDYADGSWTEWLDTSYLEQLPYIKSIVDFFKEHTTVTLVRLMRLAPEDAIQRHTDPTLALEVPKSVVRLTVPILNEDTEFYLNGSIVPMEPGECWYMRLSAPHSVLNPSEIERVNMSIDMIPNEWLRNIIMESDQ